ncbi:hypothetical protein B0J13DRAFT_523387 [Dactylonectria estremocensis]|uniref:Uncharacterized protein n=1 Tax=Dactylonectria estremocensis TaxID=1079267 RepID=A0A9P9F2D8_9HYPO|nr:hypothetical protein B0J13DRAFT_523387 [Dactylonectria estremocensis]
MAQDTAIAPMFHGFFGPCLPFVHILESDILVRMRAILTSYESCPSAPPLLDPVICLGRPLLMVGCCSASSALTGRRGRGRKRRDAGSIAGSLRYQSDTGWRARADGHDAGEVSAKRDEFAGFYRRAECPIVCLASGMQMLRNMDRGSARSRLVCRFKRRRTYTQHTSAAGSRCFNVGSWMAFPTQQKSCCSDVTWPWDRSPRRLEPSRMQEIPLSGPGSTGGKPMSGVPRQSKQSDTGRGTWARAVPWKREGLFCLGGLKLSDAPHDTGTPCDLAAKSWIPQRC